MSNRDLHMADDPDTRLAKGLAHFTLGQYEQASIHLDTCRPSIAGGGKESVAGIDEARPLATCIRHLLELQKVSPAAEFILGLAYRNGINALSDGGRSDPGLERRPKEGLELIASAAERGEPFAQAYLKTMARSQERSLPKPSLPRSIPRIRAFRRKLGSRDELLDLLKTHSDPDDPAFQAWCDRSLALLAKKEPALYVSAGDACREAAPPRTAQAVSYYFKARDLQVADGQQRLGAHFHQIGDADNATRFYMEAARQGQPDAAVWLEQRDISVPRHNPARAPRRKPTGICQRRHSRTLRVLIDLNNSLRSLSMDASEQLKKGLALFTVGLYPSALPLLQDAAKSLVPKDQLPAYLGTLLPADRIGPSIALLTVLSRYSSAAACTLGLAYRNMPPSQDHHDGRIGDPAKGRALIEAAAKNGDFRPAQVLYGQILWQEAGGDGYKRAEAASWILRSGSGVAETYMRRLSRHETTQMFHLVVAAEDTLPARYLRPPHGPVYS